MDAWEGVEEMWPFIAERSRSRSRSRDSAFVLMAMALVFTAAGCSQGDQKAEKPKSASSFNCKVGTASGGLTPSSITPDCEAEEFLRTVRAEKNPDLANLSDEQLVGFTRSLCAVGELDPTASTSPLSTYADFLTATAASWKISIDAVDALANATNTMCPQAFQYLQGLPRAQGSLQIELNVTGSGPAAISFNVPDGSTLTDQVKGPWHQVLHLRQSERVTLQVQPTDGAKVGCRVAVGDVVLAEAEPSTGPTTCDVAAADIDRGSAGK